MKNLNSETDVRSTCKYLLLLEINENNSEKEKSSDTDPEEDNYFLFHMGWKQWFWIRTPVYPHIFSEIKTVILKFSTNRGAKWWEHQFILKNTWIYQRRNLKFGTGLNKNL